ncbi:MAG: acyl-CoA dehydrogenase family protein [Actinomycetota bacterium]
MDPFLQDPPQRSNRFRTDRALHRNIERLLDPDVFTEVAPLLDEMGEAATDLLPDLQEQAEANPPRHVAYDAWGRRTDEIVVDPAWKRLVEIGMEAGLVAIPYEDGFGASGRVVQFALEHLFMAVSATADCPMAMTDAAARVLINEDEELRDRYVPKLTARTNYITSGQWMTEKEGGSDVGRTGTVAAPLGDGTWLLTGTKWFTSATTADIALALARPQGAEQSSRGLSLFLVELKSEHGWNGITVRRLKDKLGTKALPTAELDLKDTVAVPVGGIGRGVAKVAPMLNITRVHSAFGANSAVGQAISLSRDYAKRREAFGRKLADLPLHVVWMASIAAEYEASLSLCFRAAELLGSIENGGSDDLLARVVFPLTKLAAARQGVWACSQLLESFGGAGYLEDSGLPRLLRDAHVQCIWEGTTSVLALDVLRALGKQGAGETFLDDVTANARAYDHPSLVEPRRAVLDAVGELETLMMEPSEPEARRLAWGMARTYEASLLCRGAGWALDKHGDPSTATAARVFTARPLITRPLDVPLEKLADLSFGTSTG